jgi:hypothetical protein
MCNVINPNPNYYFEVAPKIAQVACQLYDKLQVSPDVVDDGNKDEEEESNTEEADSDNEDHYPHGEQLPTMSHDVALDGDDVWPARSNLAEEHITDAVEDLYPYGMSEMWEVPTFEDATQECIMELLQLLYGENLNNGHFTVCLSGTLCCLLCDRVDSGIWLLSLHRLLQLSCLQGALPWRRLCWSWDLPCSPCLGPH